LTKLETHLWNCNLSCAEFYRNKSSSGWGARATQRVNVRVVAATNADLAPMVAEKKFRSDLYYRLNVFPIAVPPLRARRNDIPRLVRHFANSYARRDAGDDRSALEQVQRELIVEALRESKWVVGGADGAAARLRLKRTTLAYKIGKLGISRRSQWEFH